MEKEVIDEKYIEKLEKYSESTKRAMDYSVERFDILIISLSTSGLILSIGFVKNIIKDFDKIDPWLLKTTWLLFACSLIMNLFSQVTGYYANMLDMKVTDENIRLEKGKDEKINLDLNELFHKLFNSGTLLLNAGSLFCLISAIITLILFISNHV
jgi:hypothetical protein